MSKPCYDKSLTVPNFFYYLALAVNCEKPFRASLTEGLRLMIEMTLTTTLLLSRIIAIQTGKNEGKTKVGNE